MPLFIERDSENMNKMEALDAPAATESLAALLTEP